MYLDYKDGLIIHKDGITLDLDQGETNDILSYLNDGFCAICQVNIPQGQEICCECLARIYSYHQSHHLCQGQR
jgi:predicted amidophosphoribosyltransferase